MAENKTKPTARSVDAHIAAIAHDAQRADCLALVELMRRATGEPPAMWGPSIVGFGKYRYKYASGREGESCLAGFAARGTGLAIHLSPDAPGQQALLARLGKHTMGKSCLTLRRLADVDMGVLEQLVASSVAETRRRHP